MAQNPENPLERLGPDLASLHVRQSTDKVHALGQEMASGNIGGFESALANLQKTLEEAKSIEKRLSEAAEAIKRDLGYLPELRIGTLISQGATEETLGVPFAETTTSPLASAKPQQELSAGEIHHSELSPVLNSVKDEITLEPINDSQSVESSPTPIPENQFNQSNTLAEVSDSNPKNKDLVGIVSDNASVVKAAEPDPKLSPMVTPSIETDAPPADIPVHVDVVAPLTELTTGNKLDGGHVQSDATVELTVSTSESPTEVENSIDLATQTDTTPSSEEAIQTQIVAQEAPASPVATPEAEVIAIAPAEETATSTQVDVRTEEEQELETRENLAEANISALPEVTAEAIETSVSDQTAPETAINADHSTAEAELETSTMPDWKNPIFLDAIQKSNNVRFPHLPKEGRIPPSSNWADFGGLQEATIYASLQMTPDGLKIAPSSFIEVGHIIAEATYGKDAPEDVLNKRTKNVQPSLSSGRESLVNRLEELMSNPGLQEFPANKRVFDFITSHPVWGERPIQDVITAIRKRFKNEAQQERIAKQAATEYVKKHQEVTSDVKLAVEAPITEENAKLYTENTSEIETRSDSAIDLSPTGPAVLDRDLVQQTAVPGITRPGLVEVPGQPLRRSARRIVDVDEAPSAVSLRSSEASVAPAVHPTELSTAVATAVEAEPLPIPELSLFDVWKFYDLLDNMSEMDEEYMKRRGIDIKVDKLTQTNARKAHTDNRRTNNIYEVRQQFERNKAGWEEKMYQAAENYSDTLLAHADQPQIQALLMTMYPYASRENMQILLDRMLKK